MSFEQKKILVVGGSSGIGKSVIEKLLAQGAEVWNLSRNEVRMPGVIHQTVDITEKELNFDLPETLAGLVYAPGTINLRPFNALKIEDFQRDWEVNVLGFIKIMKLALKSLRKIPSSVVLYSTVAVSQGMNYHASIAASKGAVEGLTKSLAGEYARINIRFNAIAPSLTDTPLSKTLLSSEDKRKASDNRHPLNRVGQPEDISEATLYLLSEDSSWMTGQTLHVDGGLSSIRPL
ncbi:MAG: SDR family NAD(P)-dependent oxidoreductase [Cyclobacteriaceae bacterium]